MYYKYSELFDVENERPLDRLITGGGLTRIFRTIACIGDSLSSGEFEAVNADDKHTYHDMYDYSWGQFMARANGSKVYNFSRGGMTAKEYCQSFADGKDFWNPEYKAQAYILALGVNDLWQNDKIPLGSFDTDVDFSDWHRNNTDTFIGAYTTIIQRYKEIQPRAKFFLMTLANSADTPEFDELTIRHREILYQLAERLDNAYVIDLYQYAPAYDAEFKRKFYMHGHLNPMGYVLTADMVSSYIDYIIRHNMEDFREVGFIGTDLHG